MLRQHRSTQRKAPSGRDDEAALTADIVELARQYGRYGYRRITALLQETGWSVNHKRVERIWRREGLKVPARQPRRGRLWLADGSCIRLRPQRPGHVWAYDFVEDRTHDGRKFRILTVIDEYTRECLAIDVAGSIRSKRVIEVLSRLISLHGAPLYLRSDNGPEFVSLAILEWISQSGIATALNDPGKPWQNGYIESFNGKFRDECLNEHWFQTLAQARAVIGEWRIDYNQVRPHSSLGRIPPAKFAEQHRQRAGDAAQSSTHSNID